MLTELIALTAICIALSAVLGAWSLHRRLTALRDNCHLRAELGHLRKYHACSAAVRSRAESN